MKQSKTFHNIVTEAIKEVNSTYDSIINDTKERYSIKIEHDLNMYLEYKKYQLTDRAWADTVSFVRMHPAGEVAIETIIKLRKDLEREHKGNLQMLNAMAHHPYRGIFGRMANSYHARVLKMISELRRVSEYKLAQLGEYY